MSTKENDPRLFLFCIGGTGSRVLKSLAFLLASGVKIKASKIIPIILDPDRANGDVNRTIEVLQKYQEIHRVCRKEGFVKNRFFVTPIETLGDLDSENTGGQEQIKNRSFKFGIDGTKEGKFRDFIGFDQLQGPNAALVASLFSEKNLNANLNVGFKGNPHMGSVVLNKFSESEDFRFFSSRFRDNDRIFIVSSIFGGTGAAGFPMLVKNLREPRDEISNGEFIRNSKLGAITVLPYFGIAPDEQSEIDKGTFISKTKAALSYYTENISGNRSLNAMYYIYDKPINDYPNNEGEAAQKNLAHVIELISSLAVIDFMEISDGKLHTQDGKATSPIYREFGLEGNPLVTNMTHFGRMSKAQIFKPLVQYQYASEYWFNNLKKFPTKQPWVQGRPPFEDRFLSEEFYGKDLTPFNQRFREWIKEMSQNERSFFPFQQDVSSELLHTIVNGINQKKHGFPIKKPDWDYFKYENYLNKVEKEVGSMDLENRFMSLFYQATELIFNNHIQA